MRLIKFTDLYTGEIGMIRAVSNTMISNFEILLPFRYRMIYSGFEGWFANRIDLDLDSDSISKCQNKIIVINLDPKPIDYIYFSGLDEDTAIERYKYIVANSSIITIELDDDKHLIDVEVSYEVKDIKREDGYPHLEEIYLINEDDKYDRTKICIARSRY